MEITRKSTATGIRHTLDLPITDAQIAKYHNGALVQDAFPHLTADQREFIISGTTAEEWDNLFKGLDE